MTSASMIASTAGRIPRRRHRSFRTAAQRRFTRTADRYCRRARHHGIDWGADGTARIGAFTTIAAIAADARIARRLSGPCRRRARSRDAANPSSRHARRQSRAALALLVFSQSAYRLPQEGRTRIARPAPAIISTALPSISAPASRRIPRPWRRRCWPMTRTVTTDRRSDLTIGELLGRRLQWRRRSRAAVGRDDPEYRASTAGPGRARALQARHQPQPCGVAAGRSVRPRGDLGRRVPVHPHRGRRHRAGAAPPLRVRGRVARRAGNAATIAECREAGDGGAKPLPMTGYKLDLLRGVVHDLLERLAA